MYIIYCTRKKIYILHLYIIGKGKRVTLTTSMPPNVDKEAMKSSGGRFMPISIA